MIVFSTNFLNNFSVESVLFSEVIALKAQLNLPVLPRYLQAES